MKYIEFTNKEKVEMFDEIAKNFTIIILVLFQSRKWN